MLTDATGYLTTNLVGTITNGQLAGSIAGSKLLNTTIDYAKLNLTDGDIPGAKITGNSITATQLATNSVTATELADDAVDTAAIANGAVVSASIATDTIVAGNIAADAITASELANNAVDTNAILDDAVTADKLANNLPGTILATGAIGSTQLAADSVTASEIAANAVTATELADNAVDAGALAAGAVENAKLAANAVTNVKITDGTITAAKLNTSNIDRSLNVASGNLGINNTVTAATRSGITYNAQGLITGTVALAAADLPVATASAVGGVSIGTGLTVSGAGALSLTNSVTGATVSGITFNNQGMITAATALVAGDLPVATTSAKGAVQITSGGGLTIDGNGNLTTSTSGVSAGTYQSVTVNTKGVITGGAALTSGLIPDLAATKITSGTLDAARIGADTIDGTKLSNASTALFQSIAQQGYPTAQFSGQILFDTVSEDAYIWDGNAWQAITTLTKGSLVFGGNYNANTSKMTACTSAGLAAGLAVGSNLPTPSATTDGLYVVVDTAGTPSAPAPVIAFSPPDYILGVTNSSGSSWNEIDLSQTVAGQVASNITFTPYGQLSSTNVQDALQEVETEKLALAGGTVTGQVLIGNTGSLVFEGSTVDAFETTLTVADPTTSDKTITLPNVTGTVITTGDTGTVNHTMILDGTILNADINASAAIAFTKLADLTSAQILVGNGSNEPTAVAVTGDIGINNAGLTSIAAGVIVDADISGSAAITGSKIATGTTSAVGVLQLTDSASSTSATTAATPAAVKTAKDAADAAATTANAALPTTGGTLTGNLILDNAKELRLSEADSDGAHFTGFKAQAQLADITYTLPATAPTTGQVLKSGSTATTLEWGSDSATDATKMPLTGGTFTGDVTFTGDASNVVWDKSASEFTGLKKIGDSDTTIECDDTGTQGIEAKIDNNTFMRLGGSGSYNNRFAVGPTGNEYIFAFTTGSPAKGRVHLKYGDSTRVETLDGGINVVGTVTDDGATHDGDVTFKGDSSDGLWDKSASAFVANLTGNASGSSGSCTGNAATATALATARTIGGVSFDGTANINLPGVNASGTQDTSGTAALATEFTVTANNTTDETVYPIFVDAATGSQGAESDTGLTYNPSSGLLTSTGFAGALTGNVTGDVTGNCSGTALSVTQAAQTAITSVGALTSLASGNITLTGATDADGTLKIKPNGSGTMARVQLAKGDDSAFAELSAHWGSGNLFVQSGTGGFIEYRAQGTTTHRFKVNSTLVATIESDGVHDTKGNLRSIPQNTQGSTYTLVAADAGKHILASGTVTVPDSVFSAGDAVTIVNNTGSDLTITKTITTMYLGTDATSTNRTLSTRGMATILFASGTVAYISGAGLS